jgi:hypothetical protein
MRSAAIYSIIAVGALSAIMFLTSCSMLSKRVNAFERNILSKPGMALLDNPKEKMAMNHMFNAREGSVGGLGGAGGGCGCN